MNRITRLRLLWFAVVASLLGLAISVNIVLGICLSIVCIVGIGAAVVTE